MEKKDSLANPNAVNTAQWDDNSAVLIQSQISKIHRGMVLRRSKFPKLVTDKNAKILDIGCGSGPFLKYFASQGFRNLYGIEPDVELTKYIPANINAHVKNCRAEDIDFADNTFDVVFIYCVLHHLKDTKDYEAACREACRVLKPDGLFFLMEPGSRRVFKTMEFVSRLLRPFSRTSKALDEVLVEEKDDLYKFIRNRDIVRKYLTRQSSKVYVDKLFLYTWIFTIQKSDTKKP